MRQVERNESIFCGSGSRSEYQAPRIEVIEAESCRLMEPSVRADGATWTDETATELEFLDFTEPAGARRRNIWDAPTGVFEDEE